MILYAPAPRIWRCMCGRMGSLAQAPRPFVGTWLAHYGKLIQGQICDHPLISVALPSGRQMILERSPLTRLGGALCG